ncbi:hypothetical protein E4U10_004447 [Claviceps purpurea]|nr:hypothetical protein E4U10_004447 [Claviceps purpurea]
MTTLRDLSTGNSQLEISPAVRLRHQLLLKSDLSPASCTSARRESEVGWAPSSGKSSNSSDVPSPTEPRSPDPVVPDDDDPDDTTGNAYKRQGCWYRCSDRQRQDEEGGPGAKDVTLSTGQLPLAAAFRYADPSREESRLSSRSSCTFNRLKIFAVYRFTSTPYNNDCSAAVRRPLPAMRRTTLTLARRRRRSSPERPTGGYLDVQIRLRDRKMPETRSQSDSYL